MEIVISLLMFLGDPPQLKEHLLMSSVGECLKRKGSQQEIQMQSTDAVKLKLLLKMQITVFQV